MARRTSIDTLLAPRVAALTGVLTAALAGEPDAVHQARVASRRLREVLPALAMDDAGAERAVRKDVRRVTRAFGVVRELDVAIEHFDATAATTPMSATARATTRRLLQVERAAALRTVRVTLTPARLRRLQVRLDRVAATTVAEAGAVKAVMGRRIARRASGVTQAVTALGAVYMPGRLHAVRIAVKRLRYALEAGRDARGARASSQLAQLKAIQDLLGRAHDLHVLAERVRDVQITVVPRSRATARDLGVLARALDRECRALHAAFMTRRQGLLTLSTSLVPRAAAPRTRSVA